MYQEYFNLLTDPFGVTPDPQFLFLSRQHEEALGHLRYGIENRMGFIEVTGEVGCGKTTLCRALLNELSDEVSADGGESEADGVDGGRAADPTGEPPG